MDNPMLQQEEIHLRDYWRILRRRYRLFLLVFGLVFLGGSLFTFLQTPLYRGEATVLVEESRPSQIAVLEGFADMGGAIAVETEMELIRSRTIAEKVVQRLGLDTEQLGQNPGSRVYFSDYRSSEYLVEEAPEFTFAGSDGDTYQAFGPSGQQLGTGHFEKPFVTAGGKTSWVLHRAGPAQTKYRVRKLAFNEAVRDLRLRMSVHEVGKKTNVIRVTVDLEDPYASREVANTLTEVYVAQNIAFKSQEASQTLDFLEKQLESIRGNLEKGEQELDEFKSEKGIFVLSETAQKLIEQLSKLEITRADIELQNRQITALIASIKNAGERDGPYMLGQVSLPDPLITQLIGELSQHLVELRMLRQDFTDDNPRISIVRAQVDELKSKVRLAIENGQKATENRLETVNKIIERYEQQLRTLPQAERQLAALTRKSAVNADLYTFLLKKHEEARISLAGVVGNVRVIDPSTVPEKPVSPKKKRNLAVFFLAGLVIGLSAVFFVEYVDDSVKSLEEIEERLGLNVYGVIPFVEKDSERPVFLSTIDPRSPVQEAFRSLRTNIQFFDSESKARSILCTSALPGVGKTTTTVNLAVALAQGGSKVLLVDCDLRRPQVHRFFNLPLEPGLTNALTGGQPWVDFVKTGPELGKLSVLTAGTIPPNPAEFLGSQQFASFLLEAEKVFEYVLVDIPPIVAFTDAAVVANKVDAVFVVLEIGQSSLPLVGRALDLLRNVQAKTRGAIVNKMNFKGGQEGYYAYSYSDYYYGNEQPKAHSSQPLVWMRKILSFLFKSK